MWDSTLAGAALQFDLRLNVTESSQLTIKFRLHSLSAFVLLGEWSANLKLSLHSHPDASTYGLPVNRDLPLQVTFRLAEYGSDQFRVEVLSDFLQSVVRKAKNKTIVIVVGQPALCHVASPRFHHDVLSFCN